MTGGVRYNVEHDACPRSPTTGATARPSTSAPPSNSERANSRPSLKTQAFDAPEPFRVHAAERDQAPACPGVPARPPASVEACVQSGMAGSRIDRREEDQRSPAQQGAPQFPHVVDTDAAPPSRFIDDGESTSAARQPSEIGGNFAIEHAARRSRSAGAAEDLVRISASQSRSMMNHCRGKLVWRRGSWPFL